MSGKFTKKATVKRAKRDDPSFLKEVDRLKAKSESEGKFFSPTFDPGIEAMRKQDASRHSQLTVAWINNFKKEHGINTPAKEAKWMADLDSATAKAVRQSKESLRRMRAKKGGK